MRLRSIAYDTIWPAQRELVAECQERHRIPVRPWRGRSRHIAPVTECECGIHAVLDPESAAGYLDLYDDVPQPSVRHRAIGQVSLWGYVVEGELGWRASRAYPQRLFLPAEASGARHLEAVLDGLSDYAVPIEIVGVRTRTRLGRAVTDVREQRRRASEPR